jgi:RNA polymerase sigma-70 factor (ECF subfamily)
VARESVRLAFVSALQHLPAKQRAVLILRDVLRWKADEVAELLDTTVASANSALQRARATMATSKTDDSALDPMDDDQQALLMRYVAAFEAYDIEALVRLLHDDATQSMPPYQLWLDGPADIAAWHLGPGIGCAGSRLVPVLASGLPAFAAYKPDPETGELRAWSIQVVEVSGGLISHVTHFLEPNLYRLFGLPLEFQS